ncbi:type I polyketide synthase [Amycolatopsis sp. AA4]|uniref:type I polyketide synthase n=1 Tax=Actinomycetes TaxID=1760 RepID=UPI0001B58080|nr:MULTISPECIES: type I polyketide synthase [Actinomycetes]ATY12378.1 type I polyketide synthase [Amycolatopsis sp. AA4]EFL08146.1 predicted protein [Streptomyces sp. AA4]
MASAEELRDYLARTAVELRRSKHRLREMEQREREPVAVIGMGCRLPGGIDRPEAFWRLLAEGGDAISEFPDDRGWKAGQLYHPDPDHPGTCTARQGGFLRDATLFDPEPFAITPREAAAMDPQQRIALETAWHTVEHAGLDANDLKDTPVGTFVGVSNQDYLPLLLGNTAARGHALTGTITSVLSGRIAYTLGWTGPALTIDTACSSSLVALHHAARSLRHAECDLALAGGATVLCTPMALTAFSQLRALAADGRCKAFAATADGMGIGEGVVLLMLERLSDAQRHHHPVWAVIRSSFTNSDGRSNGLSAPSASAQRHVIAKALETAGLTAGDIDAVDAHGTGTKLGDPIEAQALLAVYGQRQGEPLWLGSAKSNLGHTQAAAGAASVLKMVLAMRHGTLPESLHIDAPTPLVDWGSGNIRLATRPTPWPALPERPRRAAVSSFGISGTNAHLILEAAPEAPEPPSPGSCTVPRPRAYLLSAHTGAALSAAAAQLAEQVRGEPEPALDDVAHSLAHTRTALPCRAAVVAETAAELTAGLDRIASGGTGFARAERSPRTAFVFPHAVSPSRAGTDLQRLRGFRAAVDACAEAFSPFLTWSLADACAGRAPAPDFGDPAVAGPWGFTFMIAAAAVWQEFGIQLAATIGDGLGAIAAAHVAGSVNLPDSVRLILALSTRTPQQPAEVPPIRWNASATPVHAAADYSIGDRITDASALLHHAARSTSPVPSQGIPDGTGNGAFVTLDCAGVRDAAHVYRELERLHARGVRIDWKETVPAGRRTALPLYPFQRTRYWPDDESAFRAAEPAGTAHRALDRSKATSGDLDGSGESGDIVSIVLGLVASVMAGEGENRPARIPADHTFRELGFDSLLAENLLSGLTSVLKRPVRAGVFSMENTPAELADRLSDDSLGWSEPLAEAGTSLDSLMRSGSDTGQGADVFDLLGVAARLRPRFDDPARSRTRPPLKLSRIPDAPHLICLKTITPTVGDFEYTPLARVLGHSTSMTVLPYPGFAEGEPIPEDFTTLAEAQAEAVLRNAEGKPFTLMGHSSGGLIGYRVAELLEERGTPASALIMGDTAYRHSTTREDLDGVLTMMLNDWGRFFARDNAPLTAMGWYWHLFSQWEPRPISTPTMLIRATEGATSDSAGFHGAWPHADKTVFTPGTHFTMMTRHAARTAAHIAEWLHRYA